MSLESFNPNKLLTIPGQEGIVEDTEKAELMAEEEEKGREFARKLTAYMEDPDSVDWSDSPYADHDLENFHFKEILDKLIKNGLTPEYVIEVSKLMAEREGNMFDFRKGLEGISDEQLEQRYNDLDKYRFRNELEDIFSTNPFATPSGEKFKHGESVTLVNRSLKDKTFREKIGILHTLRNERKYSRSRRNNSAKSDAA